MRARNFFFPENNSRILIGAPESPYPSCKARGMGRMGWGNEMKPSLLLVIMGIFVLMPCMATAGVLENTDLDDYRYETFGPGGMLLTSGTIYSQSVQSDICNDGCQLNLLKTGQTITMQPDDYIVINDGVMKHKGQ
jgi:hypothetical protein